jgi:hypothetical protein
MVYSVGQRPDAIARRVLRPVMMLIITSLAASVCILGTIHLFVPVLTGV